MRAFSLHTDALQLGLADVPPDLVPAVERLAFERAGAVGGWIGVRWSRAFGPARIEGVGDFAGRIVDELTITWRSHELRVGRIA